jgi:hypothetical protein
VMKSTTVKMLFALSGNRCAFPRCRNRLVEQGVVVGEMCHIEAKEPGGPRYSASQTDAQREAIENFILLCAVHHKVIDTKPIEYPGDLLRKWKARHQGRSVTGPTPSPLNADQVRKFKQTLNVVHAVTSINQQGGQTAYQITNIIHEQQKPASPLLVPVVESWMTGADNQMQIDRYDFRVKLRNSGEITAREFRLEVEVPNAYANPSHSSLAEIRNHNRGDVTLYRHTHEKFPGFTLYPDETSDHVLLVDYQIRHEQYKDVNDSIRVFVLLRRYETYREGISDQGLPQQGPHRPARFYGVSNE